VPRHQLTFQRIAAWCGIGSMIVFLLAFVIAGWIPPMAPHWSARYVARYYQEHATRIRAGACVMLLSGAFYAVYTGVISAQMKRMRAHSSAIYGQQVAGAFGCVGFLLPAMFFVAAAFRPERSPAITQALNDLSWVVLVLPFPPFLAQSWCFAYAIFTDRQATPVFPRWLGYINIVVPLCFFPDVLLAFFQTGPFDWRGVMVFWLAGTVFCVQLSATLVCLLRAIAREGREAPLPAPAPTEIPLDVGT
jgi:hypothetical protein